MKTPDSSLQSTRRQFVGQVAQGTLLAGASLLAGRPAWAAEKNPFAYDVSRFAKTDPALIGWEEVGRQSCPGQGARRIACGPGDVLHVAAGNQILRLGAAGATTTIEVGATVNCVAVAADGTIFAGLRDHLEVFGAGGKRRAVWAASDARSWISGLALGPDSVFAADSGQRVIWRYDWNGKVVSRIGSKDAARQTPGLIVPSPFLDVRLHADGLLRVNNPGRHRFEAYTVDGDFAGSWGVPSAAIQGFCGCCNPIGLALLPDGRTVTCEKGLARVKVFRSDGELESVVAGPESFAANVKAGAGGALGGRVGLDVVVDSRGRIHILDRVTGEICVLQPKQGRA
jgi:hypothetical protein